MEALWQAFWAYLSRPIFEVSGQTLTLGDLLLVPTVLVVGYVLARWVAKFMVKRLLARGMEPNLVHLIRRLFYVAVIAILIVTTLDLINVPITAFAFISGALAIGVGFGAQNIVNNFISGWILLWERPIRIGDFLEVGDAKGSVEAINTRSTRIRRVDGVHMLIPNSTLLENTVVNWTLVDNRIRTSVSVGVAYGSPVEKVRDLITQAVNQQQHILEAPAPLVLFDDFGDNALAFEVFFWVNAIADRDLRIIRSDVRFAIDKLFKDAGVVIAFPQRDVHLDGSLTLVRSKS